MRIDAYWSMCDDGVARPVIDAHVLGLNDVAFYDRFLVDVGADRTMFTANLARKLMLPTKESSETKGRRHRRRSWICLGANGDS